jgi:hypothetical protein
MSRFLVNTLVKGGKMTGSSRLCTRTNATVFVGGNKNVAGGIPSDCGGWTISTRQYARGFCSESSREINKLMTDVRIELGNVKTEIVVLKETVMLYLMFPLFLMYGAMIFAVAVRVADRVADRWVPASKKNQ